MNRQQLFGQICAKRSFLCIGLDTDIEKLPSCLLHESDPVFAFNKAIIDATADLCVAYKPNMAFYERMGAGGIKSFEQTVAYIRSTYPEQFIIADAKRGDIGNTSAMYARYFFDSVGVDALTVSPYMGEDSVRPFLGHAGRWVILLALTSNKGAADFQFTSDASGEPLFEKVLRRSQEWGTAEEMMYVTGATQSASLQAVRRQAPDHFLLVPGIGAQGGSLIEVARAGMNAQCGLLVNSSRAILYASSGSAFASAARRSAKEVQTEMQQALQDLLPSRDGIEASGSAERVAAE
ncbi:MAG: orotidine-5'-phosphate decarboxylase [Tannerellaceae bacterium]|jgi:orotidine-5'-phosphate decarboxylase|nr:orotidine-5'-phosphate decarboxylase [Tannerellaceae bacterium]